MDSITIRVSSLVHAAAMLNNDRCTHVTLTLLESEEDDGELVPACLHFDAYDPNLGTFVSYDDLDIEEVEEP